MADSWTMPRFLRFALVPIALGTVVVGCGPSIQVYSYWGPGLRFSETAKTYAWVPDALRASDQGRPENPRVGELIRQAIEKHLALKGYEKAAAGTPDFWIDYRVAREVRGDPYGGVGFSEFTEGTLALYVVNPENSKLIWRGIVKGALDPSIPLEERVKRLDLAVQKMLDQVPSRKAAR